MPDALPRIRWWRRGFSLRVLMAFVLVLGGGLGWLAYRARVQRQAVAAIKAAGGRVMYEWGRPDASTGVPATTPPWPKWFVDFVGIDYLSSVSRVTLDANDGVRVDDALLAQVGRLDRLEVLDLFGNASVTDDSLIHLRNLERLTHLDLNITGVKGSGLQHLRSLHQLQTLMLGKLPLKGSDLAQIKDLVSLKRINIESQWITDQDLAFLESLSNLESVSVACPKVTSAGLVHLAGLEKLHSLGLRDTKVNTLKPLEGLIGLKSLVLNNSRIDDSGLAPIAGLRGLEFLEITGPRVTDVGLRDLAGLTELRQLRLTDTNITDTGLVHLTTLNRCLTLDLRGTQVTANGIAALSAKQPSIKITGPVPRTALSLVDSIIFQPRNYVASEWPKLDLSIDDVWILSPDGEQLNGWFAEPPRPRAVVLYTHGNAANISYRKWVIDLFRDRLNCTVLIFDYRGYGRSEGTPSEAGILMDARAARAFLAKRAGVAEKDIVIVGHSLGGGVAVNLAAKDGARGLVLENTFTSLPDITARAIRFLPMRQLVTTRLDSLSKIVQYHGPLLQTHGDADLVIPFELGKRLFDAANEPKRFIQVPGGGHSDRPTREYLDALDRFLDELPASSPP